MNNKIVKKIKKLYNKEFRVKDQIFLTHYLLIKPWYVPTKLWRHWLNK